MKSKKELKNQRAAKLGEAQKLADTAQAEKRELNTDEKKQFDQLMDEAESLGGDIARLDRLDEQRRQEIGLGVTGTETGLSDTEVRSFSIARLIAALQDPANARAQKEAAFELEACQEAAKVQGRNARGVIIPQNMGLAPGAMARLENEGRSIVLPVEVMSRRGMTVGTAANGGNLVATDLLSDSLIDNLQNALALNGLGITTLSGLVGNVSIPKKTGVASSYWLAENDDATPSTPTIGQVPLSPKTIGALIDFSRSLTIQSSISVEEFVRSELIRALALGIDLAGIAGTGTANQPLGILNTTGIGSVLGGTNGAAPNWDQIVDLETEVAIDNADIGSLAYLTNAKVRGKLKKTKVDDGSGMFVWDRLNPDTPLNGYRAAVSNQVPGNATKGTGTNLSSIIFGNWSDLVMGLWGGLDLLVDPFTGASNGKVRVVAFQSVDFANRHAESFAAMKDAITQ